LDVQASDISLQDVLTSRYVVLARSDQGEVWIPGPASGAGTCPRNGLRTYDLHDEAGWSGAVPWRETTYIYGGATNSRLSCGWINSGRSGLAPRIVKGYEGQVHQNLDLMRDKMFK